jgi:acetoin utilization deacetylase AcuC-like enzyme
MTTGIVYHEEFLRHEQHPYHPERRERLAYTDDQLTEEGIWDDARILRITPRPATDAELLAVHDPAYLAFLRKADRSGGVIDMDTLVPKGFLPTALLAAGGTIAAAGAVLEGRVRNAFAMVRPPGHHASRYSGAGFCYLNNIAIMVRAVRKQGIERVMILDWDAHHGNGTQAIFEDDPSVLFTSIHQSPFYPGSGSVDEAGIDAGAGFTINMPVPAGSSDEVYSYLIEEVIRPVAGEFAPEFIAISAGQDSHFTDPLTGLALTAGGYAAMMASAVDLATELCGGRLVAVLEGGYSVEGGLPYTNLGVIAALAGMDLSNIREPLAYLPLLARAKNPHAPARVREMVGELREVHREFWNCFS